VSNVTIFEEQSSLPTVKRESKLSSAPAGLRRIGLNTNGTFKRIVGGEQIGKAIPHELNIIIVDRLDKVSRKFYEAAYDANATPTLPDCWSGLGDKPDPKASNPQASSCNTCPRNVEGSGTNGRGKACRYERRLAVLAEGDPSGEVYQLTIPAKSLFGKGVGTTHPYESYEKYLRANNEGPDTVVTKVMYDLEADTMALKFRAVRHLTATEGDMVDAAQADPETKRYIQLTVADTEGTKAIAAPAAKPVSVFGDDEEPTPEDAAPVKRASKKAEEAPAPKRNLAEAINQWGSDED